MTILEKSHTSLAKFLIFIYSSEYKWPDLFKAEESLCACSA